MQKMNWQRLFKLRTANTEFKSGIERWSLHSQSNNKDGRAYIQSNDEVRDPWTDMEQETIHYHRWSVALTFGQGIPNYINVPLEE